MSLPSKPGAKRIRWFDTGITTSRYYAVNDRLLKPSANGKASSIRVALPANLSPSCHYTEATYLAINEIIASVFFYVLSNLLRNKQRKAIK